MNAEEIRKTLFSLRDETYRNFQIKLIPTVPPDTVIGVRTPDLRKLAKTLVKDKDVFSFLHALPHRYFDENQLHAFILSEIKNYENCVKETEAFLPHIDNWATCDQLSPAVFKKHKQELMPHIDRWLSSDKTYTVRFAVGMLLANYLDADFEPSHLEKVAALSSDEYYIMMMKAWYFATALAKNYDEVLPFIENDSLDKWTRSKAIQKARESFRVSDEHKEYLKSLKRSD